ncbi:MFS transporter [Campylobacter canadensis]|uniref:MFS transporter n=1 Tax=Campylobacter canadensis TaxID=449520 RepID=A0ABS7WTK7_9BACT|nr:MFS transporter [Campylobacter canadensis]MBZ7988120.1 MFS transporter [Campylobacter canadensis]MBZ7995578.1 MFS transporter [Campylobacter canadensis]MBZ7997257.1 MFS transporter [Campylobacter canadensis]MBZ7999112.1 MFS transporter [Campylobacter canadensis]MBZ8000911.1 MFS transporter [Campylobacter canadensis]
MFFNYTKRQKKILLSSALGMCLEMMDIMFIAYALSSIINEFSLSGKEAGFISSATNIAMLVGGLFFGFLADRYGKIKIFSYSIILFAIGTAFIYYANTYFWLVFFRVLAGLGAGGEYGVGMGLLACEFKKENMGKLSSIIAIFGQVGVALAAILAALLLDYGWRYLFLIGIIPVLLAVWIRFSLKEESNEQIMKINYKSAFKGKILLSICLCIMSSIQIAGYFGLMNWLPTIAKKTLDLSNANASYWMISTILGMSIGMWVFGKFFDKFGARISFSIFLIGSSVCVFLFTLIQNYNQLILIGFIIGFFSNGMFAGYGALVNILYDKSVSASANNIIVNVGRAIGGMSPFVIGAILDKYNSVYFVMCFLSSLYIISFLVMINLSQLKSKNYNKFKAEI